MAYNGNHPFKLYSMLSRIFFIEHCNSELGDSMEESLCNIEFLEENGVFIAKLQSPLGGLREYRGISFEEVLDQVMIELQQEFEGVL